MYVVKLMVGARDMAVDNLEEGGAELRTHQHSPQFTLTHPREYDKLGIAIL